MELRKFVAPEFVYGKGALDLVARYAMNFGAAKPLIVTDPGVQAAGWADRVAAALAAVDLPHALFAGVSPNPRAEEVAAGVECYRAEGCDVILAVGGGSPMDCAKGIGIAHSNARSVLAFEGVDQVAVPGPPLLCIPTTAGTAADVSQFAIISDRERRVKVAIVSKTVVPDAALIDPSTTLTMDPYLTACTGMDALVHAVEAFVSTAHSPITDLHALKAMELVAATLPEVIRNPADLALRSRMMLASLHAGLAFSNASLGAVHAMAHSLGGLLDLPHGECNSLLLAPVVAFNFEYAEERFREVARALGLDPSRMVASEVRQALIARIEEIKDQVGILGGLGERGVRSDDIPQLARNALLDACMATNPRIPRQRDIEVVYGEAL